MWQIPPELCDVFVSAVDKGNQPGYKERRGEAGSHGGLTLEDMYILSVVFCENG